MAIDRFTETTRTGWFSRIGSSLAGILGGLLLGVISLVLLWWNEGRSVTTARGLAEGAQITVESKADSLDPELDGKLVHVVGKTTLRTPATDETFGLTAPDLVKLRRTAEMYQWVEETKQTTKTKVGGSEETVTEYSYVKKWDEKLHPSSDFRHPQGHENPQPAVRSAEFQATEVKLGAHHIPAFLLDQWTDYRPHPLPDVQTLPDTWRAQAQPQGEWLLLSRTPQAPVVGDLRIQFESIRTGDASVLARQLQDTFEAYLTTQGTSISRIASGIQSKEAMFAAAEAENTFLAWLLRAVGFLLMFLGLLALFQPFKVLADVLPIAGKIVGAGTGIVSFLLAAVGSLTIIALAWLWYRPVLGIALLVLAVGGLILLKKTFKPKAA